MVVEMNDQVSIAGEPGVWKVVGSRTVEPCWEVQLGTDGASKRWAKTSDVTVVTKEPKLQTDAFFVPTKGIMG
ncbi:MAG: hypothetical protein ABR910_11190 [Acidobacteriaceae bacterium]|jgi:hypothetical protein